MGGNFPLESSESIRWERKEKGGKKKKEKKRAMRSSTFSLRFTEIGPSVFIGVTGKVHLFYESFAWAQESRVFAKLQEVGVSLLLWLFLV